jgi:hypothetical protein
MATEEKAIEVDVEVEEEEEEEDEDDDEENCLKRASWWGR